MLGMEEDGRRFSVHKRLRTLEEITFELTFELTFWNHRIAKTVVRTAIKRLIS